MHLIYEIKRILSAEVKLLNGFHRLCFSIISSLCRVQGLFLTSRWMFLQESRRAEPWRHQGVQGVTWRLRRGCTCPKRTAPPCMTVRVC